MKNDVTQIPCLILMQNYAGKLSYSNWKKYFFVIIIMQIPACQLKQNVELAGRASNTFLLLPMDIFFSLLEVGGDRKPVWNSSYGSQKVKIK